MSEVPARDEAGEVGGEKEEINQNADFTGWRSGQAETPVSRLDVGFQTSAPT